MVTKQICDKCKHNSFNHGDGTGIGCRAFPKGIPYVATYSHSKIIEGQVGDYVFEEAKYEDLPPFAKWLWDKARELGMD